ncbi:MAG: hypothetical protein DMF72_17765 [Acidobacteria bacterium]|nr:MAG: hypothetical protein DMF72_17765 [Acidobacteriota bacterium]
MELQSSTAIPQHLAKTIMDHLKKMLAEPLKPDENSEIAAMLRENVDKVTCFSDLHDYMDANTLGESEEIWEELTDGIGPEGDEKKVQAACGVVNEARTIVDEWIKRGGLKANLASQKNDDVVRT